MLQLQLLNPNHDASEIESLLAGLYVELFGRESVLDRDAIQQILLQWQQSSVQHWFYKVRQENELLGFFTLSEAFAFFAHGSYGIINEFWVSPAFRNHGVGKKILAHIQLLGQQQQWSRIDVSAPADDKWLRSFAFYQQNGLVFTGKKLKMMINP
ncbi:GNAT family N-acetyltransferase [Alteromonadaceae bacterium BrNp21-10]|nr:GNAT family N-acetyltransferase [Alteromonadaceae bacterium BrNp21-10]